MPKAEVGSTKYIANKMKSKGLQRLRWYCQICQKQCRDENGFKQHTMSEGHVRSMLQVGEDPRKYINEYSNQFKRDFLQLLKTSHGEKKVHMNHFYQEYIHDKEHIHMNSTKWPSLTEFAKYLGREGLCRVEEGDKGLEIQWIDDSVEAVRRKEDIKRKERLAKGDEDVESRLLEQQIRKAREAAEKAGKVEAKPVVVEGGSGEPVKVSLSLGSQAAPKQETAPSEPKPDAPVAIESFSATDPSSELPAKPDEEEEDEDEEATRPETETPNDRQSPAAAPPPKLSLSLGGGKPKFNNPLMQKKNPLSKKKDVVMAPQEKKMSNAERIMKEEMERKRVAQQRGGGGKRQRLG